MNELMKSLIDNVMQPMVITIAVPFVVNIFKTMYKSIPSWALPIAATMTGPILAYLSNVAGIMEVSVTGGAMAGLAAVGIRELTNQLVTKKITPLT